MPRKEGTSSITLLLSPENRERINAFAEEQGFKITADYLRSLIEADMRSKGVDINLSPDRGGYRIRNEDKDKDE
jgi:hypothetical protein